jgi:hypothetical protein
MRQEEVLDAASLRLEGFSAGVDQAPTRRHPEAKSP